MSEEGIVRPVFQTVRSTMKIMFLLWTRGSVAQSFNVIAVLILVVAVAGTSSPAGAQWFKYPTPGAPRTASGEVDLSAPTPRLSNGKPDLSGVWMTADPACGRVSG